MALTNMKLSKKEAKKNDAPEIASPRFPFGLTINLDDEALDKLGFDSLPDVGEEFIVVGVGPIISVHENKRQNDSSRSIEIQLQRMEVGPVDGDDEDSLAAAIDGAIDDANTDHGNDS